MFSRNLDVSQAFPMPEAESGQRGFWGPQTKEQISRILGLGTGFGRKLLIGVGQSPDDLSQVVPFEVGRGEVLSHFFFLPFGIAYEYITRKKHIPNLTFIQGRMHQRENKTGRNGQR